MLEFFWIMAGFIGFFTWCAIGVGVVRCVHFLVPDNDTETSDDAKLVFDGFFVIIWPITFLVLIAIGAVELLRTLGRLT